MATLTFFIALAWIFETVENKKCSCNTYFFSEYSSLLWICYQDSFTTDRYELEDSHSRDWHSWGLLLGSACLHELHEAADLYLPGIKLLAFPTAAQGIIYWATAPIDSYFAYNQKIITNRQAIVVGRIIGRIRSRHSNRDYSARPVEYDQIILKQRKDQYFW